MRSRAYSSFYRLFLRAVLFHRLDCLIDRSLCLLVRYYREVSKALRFAKTHHDNAARRSRVRRNSRRGSSYYRSAVGYHHKVVVVTYRSDSNERARLIAYLMTSNTVAAAVLHASEVLKRRSLTESVCGESAENIFDIIRELQSHGFRVAMDDFGSGYSSLNMLKEMPLDIIKMDLRFLGGEEAKSYVILKALIELAHTMDLNVVVEGVELLSQVEFLRQFENCYLQGYYYSRPVTPDIFEDMLKHN